MSHYHLVQLNTGFTPVISWTQNETILVSALRDLGVKDIQRSSSLQPLKDKQGKKLAEKAEIIVSCQTARDLYSDIGFLCNGDMQFDALVSNVDYVNEYSRNWFSQLEKAYQYHANSDGIKLSIEWMNEVVYAKYKRHLKDIEIAVIKGTWQGYTYKNIAKTYNCTAEYLSQDVGPKLWKIISISLQEDIKKKNFRAFVETSNRTRQWKASLVEGREENNSKSLQVANSKSQHRLRIGKVPDIEFFYGREPEIAEIKKMVSHDRCRIISIIGMTGCGKTLLAAKIQEEMSQEFEATAWISLNIVSTFEEIIDSLIHALPMISEIDSHSPTKAKSKTMELVDYFREHKCLLILDDIGSILKTFQGINSGCNCNCNDSSEKLGSFLKMVGESSHKSCLILTSQEKIKKISTLEGIRFPVRTFKVSGLKVPEVKKLFSHMGNFSGSLLSWRKLVGYYGGIPFVLKIIGRTINELFEDDIEKFLKFKSQQSVVLNNIYELLDSQFFQLSDIEKTLMFWLAIQNRPVHWEEAYSYLLLNFSSHRSFKALQNLGDFSLVEYNNFSLSQLPFVRDYCIMHARLIDNGEEGKSTLFQNVIKEVRLPLSIVRTEK